MTIGTRIQALRKERGMSQEELAGKLSVSRQTVSQWETEQTVPSIDNIYTLKEIFDVSFDALMSEPAENQHSTAAIPHRHGETRYTVEDIKSATRLVVMPRILGTLFAAILFIKVSPETIPFATLASPNKFKYFLFITIFFQLLKNFIRNFYL